MKKYKMATAFHRDDTIYLSSYIKTTTGLDVVAGPLMCLADDTSARELGAAIRDVVSESFEREPIPHPDDFSKYPQLKEFLSAVGCQNWRAFAKKTVASEVKLLLREDAEPERFLIDAEVADRRGGFSDVGERLELSSDVTDEVLGEAVMERLKWAREQI